MVRRAAFAHTHNTGSHTIDTGAPATSSIHKVAEEGGGGMHFDTLSTSRAFRWFDRGTRLPRRALETDDRWWGEAPASQSANIPAVRKKNCIVIFFPKSYLGVILGDRQAGLVQLGLGGCQLSGHRVFGFSACCHLRLVKVESPSNSLNTRALLQNCIPLWT